MSYQLFSIKTLLKYEEKWCETMGYFNPYIDPFKNHLTNKVVIYDRHAYKKYPHHNKVYDKLWVAKTQNLECGKLEDLNSSDKSITYPIFIKPRWGHLSATSKNCFKIKSKDVLNKYNNFKHMMWSEFIDGTEGMTDYILLNGNIVHQLTYIYSDKQNGFSEEWKFISPHSNPPTNITEWVNEHMRNFTGIVNVQYRTNKIIEVGLRPARGGAYIINTDNKALITNINNVLANKFWDFSLQNKMNFTPYYSFKCFTRIPIIYIFPQHVIDLIVKTQTNQRFYEYYFEPVGNEGMVFFQFMHEDFKKGMAAKKRIEFLFNTIQILMFLAIVTSIILLFSAFRYKYTIALIVLGLFLTRYLNPIVVNYGLYKAQKQFIFGAGPSNNMEDDIESLSDDANNKHHNNMHDSN